ncbi:UvrD-helicase domain-containing protein [Candidatus Gracilibacteria bacterium]|nr:UvrD-helicase domain-containing protein [Candidatus Gracilibacteria bacterium]
MHFSKILSHFFSFFTIIFGTTKLNPEQRIAVETIDDPLLINTGAGSGKTHAITERVVSMIQEKHIETRSIFCVTFTNKAAREMRERIPINELRKLIS